MNYIINNCKLIIEIGVNHNGSIDLAKKMIDVISTYNVEYVKFQSFIAEELCLKKANLAKYQKNNLKKKISQYEMLKKYELDFNKHDKLYNYCKKKNIKFVSSVFGVESFKLYNKFKTDFVKVPSGEITNLPLLNVLDNSNKSIILSTGMSNIKEIEKAVNTLSKTKKKNKLTLMHCVSSYPTKLDEINLNSIIYLKKKFHVPVGLSDHTDSVIIPYMAFQMGACYVEKHFTLNKNLNGPDHKASINEDQLKEIVFGVKKTINILGKFAKLVTPEEIKNRAVVRKSVYAKKNIKKGQIFQNNNLKICRPFYKNSPNKFFDLIGKKAKKNFKKNQIIL